MEGRRRAQGGGARAALTGQRAHDVPKLLKALAKLGDLGVDVGNQSPCADPGRGRPDLRDRVRLGRRGDRAGRAEDAVNARTQARHQLKAFLLRHEIRYGGKTAWSKAFYRWLGELNFGDPSSQVAFTEYHLAVQAGDQRLERLTKALTASVAGWRFEPVVQALQALRGIDGLGDRAGGRDRRLRPFRSSAQADGAPRALEQDRRKGRSRKPATPTRHGHDASTTGSPAHRAAQSTPGEAGRADQGQREARAAGAQGTGFVWAIAQTCSAQAH